MDIDDRKKARRLSINNREFLFAIADINLNKIDDLLKDGVDVNFKDRDGNTPLHWAVECGNVQAIILLLSKGASAYEKNEKSESPLDISKQTDKLNIVELLEQPVELKPEITSQSNETLKQELKCKSNQICASEQQNNDNQIINEDMLEKRKNSVHGNIYQLKLLMLFLYRGVSHKYSFRLGTEIQQAKKFDDLIFEYDINGKRTYRLLQAKHRLDENKKINATSLLAENESDFNLIKYFYSYQELKKDIWYNNGLVKDLTVCTNIDFDIENLHSNGINITRITEKDDILDIKSKKKESARYKFNESIIELLKSKLENHNLSRFKKVNKYIETDLREFITCLVFAVNQPNEDELGYIVKSEISSEFDFITAENVYNKFFMSMLNWLQGKEKGIFLSYEDGKELFVEINRGIQFWFGVKNPIESFTGRTELLDDLHRIMCEKNENEQKLQIACISGLGGVGKSELARKYISKYSQEYDNKILWINAESYETLADSFRRLACDQLKITIINADNKEKKLTSTVEDVYIFFSDKKCLFVFDNAEKYKSQHEFDNGIATFLPSFSHIGKLHILITSRNQNWPKNIKVLPLNVFSEKEASEFVKKSLDIVGDDQSTEIIKLINELQFFPLALQQAVAYIGLQDKKLKNIGSEFNISNYLKKCRQKTKEYLKFLDDNDNDYSKTTYSTWNVTFEAIREKENSKEACEILEVLSYFAPVDISVNLIKNLIKDKIKLASAIELLKQYSIVNVDNAKLSLHRLVLKVIRLHLQDQKREEEVLHKALSLFQTNILILENVEHAMSIWSYSNKYIKLIDSFSSLPCNICKILLHCWRYEELESFGFKASKQLESLSLKSPETKLNLILTKKYASKALLERGKYELSLKYFEAIYDMQKRFLGPKNCETLETKEYMIEALKQSGQYARALELCEEVAKIQNNEFGKNHPNSLSTQHSKAKILVCQGKYLQAIQLLKKIIEIQEMYMGNIHPETISTKDTLAGVLSNLGKFEEATKVEEEVMFKEFIYGKNHPNFIKARHGKGISLLRQGNGKEALPILKEAYEQMKKIYGENNPDVLSIQRDYGEALKETDQVEESLKIFKYVLQKQKQIVGPNNPDAIFTQNSIGHVFLKQKKYTEALEQYQDSLEKCKIVFGEEHVSTMRVINCIDVVYLEQKNYNESLKYFTKILRIQEETLGPDQIDTLATKHNVAKIYQEFNQLNQAVRLYKEICEVEQGSCRPDTINTKQELIKVLVMQKKYNEAIRYAKEYVQAQEITYGKNSESTLYAKFSLANLMYTVGRRFTTLKILREISDTADKETYDCLVKKHYLKKKLDDLEVETAVIFGIMELNNGEKLQLLFDNGRDVNSADDEDVTLLHYAVINRQMNMAKILLANHADTNLACVNGNTPLHVAAKHGALDFMKLLLSFGAMYNYPNKKGETPFQLCTDERGKRFLKKMGQLFSDARKGNPQIVSDLQAMSSEDLEAITKARNRSRKTLLQELITHKYVTLSTEVLKLMRS